MLHQGSGIETQITVFANVCEFRNFVQWRSKRHLLRCTFTVALWCSLEFHYLTSIYLLQNTFVSNVDFVIRDKKFRTIYLLIYQVHSVERGMCLYAYSQQTLLFTFINCEIPDLKIIFFIITHIKRPYCRRFLLCFNQFTVIYLNFLLQIIPIRKRILSA